jgi:catechol 2,3-dioxygenase-like lactoylglutathione lyase family enzyme
MTDKVTTLDHIAVMVKDLAAAGAAYERLGFRLTPVSRHSGARTPGGPVEPWGVGNRCAMLRRGYLELMGGLDPALYDNRVPEFLARYEGIHILAFGCDDAASVADGLGRRGFAAAGVHALARALETPEGERTAKFNLVRLPPEETPEGRVLAIQHLTPAYLWQERYLDHPNGAVALTELAVCVADLDEAAARYARYFGAGPVAAAGRRVFSLAAGRFVLTDADGLQAFYGMAPPMLPFAASFTVAVGNIDATAAWLDRNGVSSANSGGRLVVSAAGAHGATIVFQPEER